jgi:hypothetical protein
MRSAALPVNFWTMSFAWRKRPGIFFGRSGEIVARWMDSLAVVMVVFSWLLVNW